MNPLREKILNYHRYQTQKYIEEVITAEPIDALYQEISKILLSGETQEAHDICWFLEDTVNRTEGEIADYFRDGVYVSPVIVALESLVLHSSNHAIRNHAICTLGNMESKGSLPILKSAFNKFCESDPLLIDNLIHRIVWLMEEPKRTKAWFNYVTEAASSWSFLTRWAVLGCLNNDPDDIDNPDYPPTELLVEDEIAVVREEARFKIAEANMPEQDFPDISSASDLERWVKDSAALKKSLGITEPALTFDMLEIRFVRYLHENQRQDYHVMDLAKFVDHLLSKKI